VTAKIQFFQTFGEGRGGDNFPGFQDVPFGSPLTPPHREVRRALEERGHKIIVKKDWDPWFGAVQAVSIDTATGALYGE